MDTKILYPLVVNGSTFNVDLWLDGVEEKDVQKLLALEGNLPENTTGKWTSAVELMQKYGAPMKPGTVVKITAIGGTPWRLQQNTWYLVGVSPEDPYYVEFRNQVQNMIGDRADELNEFCVVVNVWEEEDSPPIVYPPRSLGSRFTLEDCHPSYSLFSFLARELMEEMARYYVDQKFDHCPYCGGSDPTCWKEMLIQNELLKRAYSLVDLARESAQAEINRMKGVKGNYEE